MTTKQDAFDKLVELQHLIGTAHHQRMMQHGPMADPSRGKGRVLALLKLKDGIATKDMADVLGIRVSSLNETIARLEAEGYVERHQSPTDRRVMLVYLTEKGRAEEQPRSDLPEQLFKGFEDEELEKLYDYLTRMTDSLEAELGPDWREQMHHMRHRRNQIFHQAGEPDGPARGPHDGPGPHNGRGSRAGHGRGWGGSPTRPVDARYPRDAEPMHCDHNCRACTHEACVRRTM